MKIEELAQKSYDLISKIKWLKENRLNKIDENYDDGISYTWNLNGWKRYIENVIINNILMSEDLDINNKRPLTKSLIISIENIVRRELIHVIEKNIFNDLMSKSDQFIDINFDIMSEIVNKTKEDYNMIESEMNKLFIEYIRVNFCD